MGKGEGETSASSAALSSSSPESDRNVDMPKRASVTVHDNAVSRLNGSPTRRKVAVRKQSSWADVADAADSDSDDSDDDLSESQRPPQREPSTSPSKNIRGDGSKSAEARRDAPTSSAASVLAAEKAASGTDASATVRRRGWEPLAVTQKREQALREKSRLDNDEGDTVEAHDAQESKGDPQKAGKSAKASMWADVVKKPTGSPPSVSAAPGLS